MRCLWHLEIDADPDHVETVYPDGCCEIIAHRQAPMHIWIDEDGWQPQPRCVFAAQQRTAIRLAARGNVDAIGVRLQPAASALLLPSSLIALRDRIVDLESLDLEFAERFAATVSTVTATRAADVWDLLANRLAPIPIDPRIERAVHALEACDGKGPVGPLARASGMSERSFQTTFKGAVGLSAKELARIFRLQATLRRLDKEETSMTQLALDRGFSDQAHAIREIRRVTGTTPTRLREALRRDRTNDSSVRMAAAFVRGRAV